MGLVEINKIAEFLEGLINDFANASLKRRWVKILSLITACYASVLNPYVITYELRLIGGVRPHWFSYYVWGAGLAVLLFAAFLVALLNQRKAKTKRPPRRSIIKGLLPYSNTKEDAEWFSRLQRESILQDCLRFCLGTSSSIGILSGESGTGKTSFLQAGLLPMLESQGQRAVYVKLTDLPPLSSIHQSLHNDNGTTDSESLVAMLQRADRSDSRAMILILDQFEQFFTHFKTKSSRRAFVEQLSEWYQHSASLTVKILISIRDDFADRMTELQRAMDYTLTAHNKLRLEKFEPHEAAQVIAVIAEEAAIELDKHFVGELTRDELADREDGTVSPVDIQILSWMLDGQKTSEERAFNRKAFQKLGGVEGLLQRFLSRQLDARDPESRQATVKVMLALTEQNVRAGALSMKTIKEKLGGIVSESDVEEAVLWLATSDVRLVTPVQEKNATLYELAHERIILPLRRLAFKEITDIERAQQTLDRRVNEWIGNNRKRRYLLTLKEFLLIRRNLKLINASSQKEQKEQFIAQSRRRFLLTASALVASAGLIVGGYGGYRAYERRPATQISYAQKQLLNTLDGNKDRKAIEYASVVLSVLDSPADAQIAHELKARIDRSNSMDRAYALYWLGKSYLKRSKNDVALKAFADSLTAYQTAATGRGNLMLELAKTYKEMPTSPDLIERLATLTEAANKLSRQLFGTEILVLIGGKYGESSRCDEAAEVMTMALQGITSDDSSFYSSLRISPFEKFLSEYASLDVKCEASFKKAKLPEAVLAKQRELKQSGGSRSRFGILFSAHGSRTLRTTRNSKPVAASLSDDSTDQKFSNLIYRASERRESGNADEGMKLLNDARALVDRLPFASRVDSLLKLTDRYLDFQKTSDALELLKQAKLLTAQHTSGERILWQIAGFDIQLSPVDEALKSIDAAEHVNSPTDIDELIKRCEKRSSDGGKILDRFQSLIDKAEASKQPELFLSMSKSYRKFAHHDEAVKALTRVQQLASERSSEEKSSLLARVAESYALLNNWKEGVDVALSIGNEIEVISAFSRILVVWHDVRDHTEYDDVLQDIFKDIEDEFTLGD